MEHRIPRKTPVRKNLLMRSSCANDEDRSDPPWNVQFQVMNAWNTPGMLSYVNNDARASEDRTWVRANVLSSSKVNGNIVARQRHISRVEVSENFQATREGIGKLTVTTG